MNWSQGTSFIIHTGFEGRPRTLLSSLRFKNAGIYNFFVHTTQLFVRKLSSMCILFHVLNYPSIVSHEHFSNGNWESSNIVHYRTDHISHSIPNRVRSTSMLIYC